MKFAPLTDNEKISSGGFTHRLDFSYQDIPAGLGTNVANTFNAFPLPKLNVDDIIKQCEVYLIETFQNTAVPAYATTTVSIGLVTGGVAALVAATEANANGAAVRATIPGVATPSVPIKNATAGNQLTVTLGAGGVGNSLSTLNRGKFYALVSMDRPADQARTKAPPFGPGTLTTN